MAQTLIEGGLKTLLIERGSANKLPESESIVDAWDALTSPCAELIRSVDGQAIILGNCLGGATSFNLGMYIEETPEWIVEQMGEGFGSEAQVAAAFEWVRACVRACMPVGALLP